MFEAGFVASIGSMYKLTATDEAVSVDGGDNGSGVKPCTTTIEDIVITAPKRTPTSADEEGGTFD